MTFRRSILIPFFPFLAVPVFLASTPAWASSFRCEWSAVVQLEERDFYPLGLVEDPARSTATEKAYVLGSGENGRVVRIVPRDGISPRHLEKTYQNAIGPTIDRRALEFFDRLLGPRTAESDLDVISVSGISGNVLHTPDVEGIPLDRLYDRSGPGVQAMLVRQWNETVEELETRFNRWREGRSTYAKIERLGEGPMVALSIMTVVDRAPVVILYKPNNVVVRPNGQFAIIDPR